MPQRIPLLEQIEIERGTSVSDRKLPTDSARIRRRFFRGEVLNSSESRLIPAVMKGMRDIGFKFSREADAPLWTLTNPSYVPNGKKVAPAKAGRPLKAATAKRGPGRPRTRAAATAAVLAQPRRAQPATQTAPIVDLRLGQAFTVVSLRQVDTGIEVGLHTESGEELTSLIS